MVYILPQITQPPKNTSANLHSTTNLTCKATGSPIPTILWYKDNVFIFNDNTDASVLLFPELDLTDRGYYHCEARSVINGNYVSVISSRVLLNIAGIFVLIDFINYCKLDIVQYEAKIQLSNDFYESSNQTLSEKVSDLVKMVQFN